MASVDRTQGIGMQLKQILHWRSIGRTGTGSLETIAHGLNITPTFVHGQLRDTSAGNLTFGNGGSPIVYWDRTNVYVTAPNAAIYDLMALVAGE